MNISGLAAGNHKSFALRFKLYLKFKSRLTLKPAVNKGVYLTQLGHYLLDLSSLLMNITNNKTIRIHGILTDNRLKINVFISGVVD